MKFNLNDFIELDTKELLGVNGGGGCSGTSSLSGGKSNGNQGSKKTGGSLSGSGDKPARNSGSPSTGGSSGGGGSMPHFKVKSNKRLHRVISTLNIF